MEIAPLAHIHYTRSQPSKSDALWSQLLPQIGNRVRERYHWQPSGSQVAFFQAARKGVHVLSNMGTGNAKSWSCAAFLIDQAVAKHAGMPYTFRHALCWMPTNGVAIDQEQKLRQLVTQLDSKEVAIVNYASDLTAHERYRIRASCKEVDVCFITPDLWRDSLLGSQGNASREPSDLANAWTEFLLTPSLILIDELDFFSSYTLTHLYYLLRLMRDQCHRRNLSPPQVLVNSATISQPHKLLTQFLGSGQVIEDLPRRGPIDLWVYPLHIARPDQPQDNLLDRLLGIAIDDDTGLIRQGLKILVYLQNKAEIERTFLAHEYERHGIGVIHGNLDTARNRRTLQAFRDGELHCLITTSYLDRGLDIDDLTHVILIGYPRHSINEFIQRVHRVARRPTHAGTAFLLLDENHILDRYYLAHPDAITTDLTCPLPDPLHLNPANPLVVASIVSLALLLGYATRDQLMRLFNDDPAVHDQVDRALFTLRVDGHRYATPGDTLRPHATLNDHLLHTRLRTATATFDLLTEHADQGGNLGSITLDEAQRYACPGNTFPFNGQSWLVLRHQGHQIIVRPGAPDRHSRNRLTHSLTYAATATRQLPSLTLSAVSATLYSYPTTLLDFDLHQATTRPLASQPTTPATRLYAQHATAGLLIELNRASADQASTHRLLALLGAALRFAAWHQHGISPSELTTTLLRGASNPQLLLHDTDGATGHAASLWHTLPALALHALQHFYTCGCHGHGCPHCWLRFTPTSTPPQPPELRATENLLREMTTAWT
jgi:ATP-dependent helicase YprA (DUF1998 family)